MAVNNSLENIINDLKKQEFYENQILHIEKMDKTPPKLGNLQHNIHPDINKWIADSGFSLYTHQTQAIDNILDGKNVIVVTSTASGKSLGYNIPVLDSILNENDSTFLYLFPQKALSQDQYSKLLDIFDFLTIDYKNIGIYDGDTEKNEKARIRRESRIIITNPYGLHYYLPFKQLWARFWRSLKYIIIDECHHYRGIFGSNFAQVIRRLKRILDYFKVNPIYILSSATIKNPNDLAVKLTGEKEFIVIDEDGSPNPGRYFILWDLPMFAGSDQYKSPHTQTRNIFNYIISENLQTLAFTRSRKMAELNALYSRNYFNEIQDPIMADRIISYRAGFNPVDRRRIEKGLRDRDLIGVYATNALELGVDIGTLECTILSGFPGTISSMWQQIGRAGRKYDPNKGIESLSFLIPLANPLDLYYVQHPKELISKPHEVCNINLKNKYILQNHLKCAAKESPLTEKDTEIFNQDLNDAIENLENQNILKKKGSRYFYVAKERFPPKDVELSGISDNEFKVILHQDGNSNRRPIITYEEKYYVFKELHPGAVYLYMAEPYRVTDLNLEEKIVELFPDDGLTYTDSKIHTDIQQVGKPDNSRVENGINIYYGNVIVTEQVVGYDIIAVDNNLKIGHEELNLPPVDLDTKSVWFSIKPEYKEEIIEKGYDFEGTIHAIEHGMISMAPYFTMCDRWDIGGVSTSDGGPELSGWPVIYVYDGVKGGIGISESIYEIIISLLEKTLELISNCKCKEKCPGCVMSPKCGNNNEPLDKHGAIELLKLLLKK